MQPVPPLPNYQAFEDANHLRYLAIAHYVTGGLTALFSCFPIFHVAIGGMMIAGNSPFGPMPSSGGQDMQIVGWMMLIMGSVFVLLGWSFAVMLILTGRWLSARKNHTFCFVVACIHCISLPLGTLVGVFTIIVLSRPSVKALFLAGPANNQWTRE